MCIRDRSKILSLNKLPEQTQRLVTEGVTADLAITQAQERALQIARGEAPELEEAPAAAPAPEPEAEAAAPASEPEAEAAAPASEPEAEAAAPASEPEAETPAEGMEAQAGEEASAATEEAAE